MNVAVILAAGLGSRFGDITKYVPKGMIKVGEKPMIQSSIEKLQEAGYSEILLVTGHCSEVYDNFVKKWSNVNTIKNPFYSTTGSLFSLYLAMAELRKYKFNNLTILESDIIYDRRILSDLTSENCMIISKPRRLDIGDECWIDQDKSGNITKITKNPKSIKNPTHEMVGISNITMNKISSVNDYEKIMKESLSMLSKNNREDYEQIIVKSGNFLGIETEYSWTEMDNASHLEFAIENILPKI
jgi:choline kinase